MGTDELGQPLFDHVIMPAEVDHWENISAG
jgi:hypothetical protein